MPALRRGLQLCFPCEPLLGKAVFHGSASLLYTMSTDLVSIALAEFRQLSIVSTVMTGFHSIACLIEPPCLIYFMFLGRRSAGTSLCHKCTFPKNQSGGAVLFSFLYHMASSDSVATILGKHPMASSIVESGAPPHYLWHSYRPA